MALLTLDCEVQMYEKRLELEIQRKVAGSVVAAEISDHLNAFSNISGRGTETVFLTISLSLHPFSTPLPLSSSLSHHLSTILQHFTCSASRWCHFWSAQKCTTQSINCPSVIRCMQLVNALFLKFLPTHVWLKDAAEILNSKDTFLLFLLQTNTSTSAGSSVTQISSKTYKSISHSAVVNFRSTGCFFWSFVAERDCQSTDRELRKTSHRQFGYCSTIWCTAWILETLPPKL